MINLNDLKFDEKGLIPAIIIDAETKQVLTLAYMNKESLKISLKKGLTCFWSRSRQELWLKGETSGNYQHIVSIQVDCDKDSLTVYVKKDGPACHLGTDSCFNEFIYRNKNNNLLDKNLCSKNLINNSSSDKNIFSLEDLMELINDRKANEKDGSYTTYLFKKGIDKILKKVGEESTEVIIAAKSQDKKEAIYEIADLTYHVMVLMIEMGISLEDIREELASRHVIDYKIKQEKMTNAD